MKFLIVFVIAQAVIMQVSSQVIRQYGYGPQIVAPALAPQLLAPALAPQLLAPALGPQLLAPGLAPQLLGSALAPQLIAPGYGTQIVAPSPVVTKIGTPSVAENLADTLSLLTVSSLLAETLPLGYNNVLGIPALPACGCGYPSIYSYI